MADLKIPRGEMTWVIYKNKSGETVAVTTSKDNRDTYFLYAVENGELKKLGKARDPIELAKKYNVDKLMGK